MSFAGQLLKGGVNILGPEIILSKAIRGPNLTTPFGLQFYVSKNGSDSTGNGRSWDTAYASFAAAISDMRDRINWSNSPWSNNDILNVGPGEYDEALTALPHGCMIKGAGWDNRDAQFGTKIKPSTGSPIDVGGIINCAFIDIGFETVDDNAFDGGEVNNCWFYNCLFSGPAETYTQDLFVATSMTRNLFEECDFMCGDDGLKVTYSTTNDKFAHNKILRCNFQGLDNYGIHIGAGGLVGLGNIVDGCNFLGAGTTMSYAVYDEINSINVVRCMAESTSGYSCLSVNGSYNNGALVS
jgi:hypothetical protein